MKKQISAALAAVLITTTMIPSQSFATIAAPLVIVTVPPPSPPPPMAHGSSGGAGGAAAAGGIIGVAAFLAGYDLIRRTTCSGDFLYLGGPGFTEPTPNGNVMIPQCPLLHKGRHKRH
jgi:hypothetical protein